MKMVVTHVLKSGDSIRIESGEWKNFNICVKEIRDAIHKLGPKSIAWTDIRFTLPGD